MLTWITPGRTEQSGNMSGIVFQACDPRSNVGAYDHHLFLDRPVNRASAAASYGVGCSCC